MQNYENHISDQILRAIWTSKNHYFVRFLRFQTRPPTKNSPSRFATRPGEKAKFHTPFSLKPPYKRTDLRTNFQEGSREGPGGGGGGGGGGGRREEEEEKEDEKDILVHRLIFWYNSLLRSRLLQKWEENQITTANCSSDPFREKCADIVMFTRG